MGHGQSKQRAFHSSYRTDDQTNCNSSINDKGFQTEVKEFPRVHGGGSVTSVNCINGTSMCVSGGTEGRISIFDVSARKLVMRWTAHEKEVTKVIHAGIEEMIFSASRDKLVKVWKNHSEEPAAVLSGHTLGVTSITCNSDGTALLSGSRDNSVRLWDTQTGICVKQATQARNMVTDVKWIHGTDQVVQTGEDKIMKLWDTRSLQVAKTFPTKQYFQTSCDVSNSGSYIVTGSTGFNGNGCEVTIWDVRQGKIITEFRGHSQKVSECRYMKNWPECSLRSLLISVSLDCSIKVWSPDVEGCIVSEDISGAKELKTVASFQDGRFVVGTHDYGIHYCELVEEHNARRINPVLRF